MKTYVVDNSVILKSIIREDGSELVRKLMVLKEQFKIAILVPDLFRYEFFNIIIKGMPSKMAMKVFDTFMSRQVSVVPLEGDLIELANRLVEKYPRISFYDATYHALAKAYNVDFITADKKYYSMTKNEGHVKLLTDIKLFGC